MEYSLKKKNRKGKKVSPEKARASEGARD